MFHTQLALLPAMETEGLELDLMMDDPYGEGVEGPGGAPAELVSATVGNSYVVNLAKMGIKQVTTPLATPATILPPLQAELAVCLVAHASTLCAASVDGCADSKEFAGSK